MELDAQLRARTEASSSSESWATLEDATESGLHSRDEPQDIDFVTLGMFIIDEIEYLPPLPPSKDVIGGAGCYSALGARLFSPPPLSRSVGWIVDQGIDFPPSMTDVLSTWDTSAVFRPNPDRLTTRSWNGYLDSSTECRSFRYTTPKRRLTAEDISGTPLLHARAIHIICSPNRCRDLVSDIQARRKREAQPPDSYTKPIIIWEPVPDSCKPDELLNCTNALPYVDICSPNHSELAGFMGSDGLDPETGKISTASVEQSCEQLLASMPLQSYTLVVRCGEKGCYIAKNGGRKRHPHPHASGKTVTAAKPPKKKKEYIRGGLQPDTDMEALFAGLLQDEEGFVAREEIEVDPGIEKWMPAYFRPPPVETETEIESGTSVSTSSNPRVVDPTGGGNTFLGGLAVALARGKLIEEACAWGAVAASFAIEQVGVPTLEKQVIGVGVEEEVCESIKGETEVEAEEAWNGERVQDRLREYMGRVGLPL